jgi:ketosteroid isomerase-like protein
MSGQNAELVRRIYEGGPEVERLLRSGSDLTGHRWLGLWHPECLLEEIAEVPDAASYHGRAGVVEYFQQAFGEVWDEWRFTPAEIIEGGDAVFAVIDNWGRSKAGAELEMRIFQVFRIRDGMVIRASGYLDRGEALDAAGLME